MSKDMNYCAYIYMTSEELNSSPPTHFAIPFTLSHKEHSWRSDNTLS